MPIGGHALSSTTIGSASDGLLAYIGNASGVVGLTGEATGSTPIVFIGDSSGSFGFMVSALGAHGPGAKAYTFLRFGISATGTEPFTGVIGTTFPITGYAVGIGHVQGDVAGSVGFSATGLVFGPIFGDALYDEGIFSALGTGFVSLVGASAGSLKFLASATGIAASGGAAIVSYGFTASGVGERGSVGLASVGVRFLPAIAASHGQSGSVLGSAIFSGSANGVLGARSTVSAIVPISGSAVGSSSLYPVGAMYAILSIGAHAYGLGQPEEVDVCA